MFAGNMSRNRMSEDGNAGSAQNNDGLEDELGSVSVRKEHLRIFVIHTVQQVIEQTLEPLISRIVKQEIELAQEKILTRLKQNPENSTQSSETRNLKLKFLNKLSHPVVTGPKGSTRITVALVDAVTDQVVRTGREASARVEIVVIEGSFADGEGSNCSLEEFNSKIVRGEKDGGKSLLSEKRFLNLEKGIGYVDISFTHNKIWRKNCKLRLGAIIVDNFNGIGVRPAMTDSFDLKDRRGTLYEKHYPPSLRDEVWRLDSIAKDGSFHNRLEEKNIKTVKDFLTLFFVNPQRLREILGKTMNAKMWEAAVNHAQTCELDKSLHMYRPLHAQGRTAVVFNVVGQVMGLFSDDHFFPVFLLSETEKADAHNLVLSALDHIEEVTSVDDEALPVNSSLSLNNPASNSEAPNIGNNCYHAQPSMSSQIGEEVSFDDENPCFDISACLHNGPNDCCFEASCEDDEHDHTQPSTSSHVNEELSFSGLNSATNASLHSLYATYLPTLPSLENIDGSHVETAPTNDANNSTCPSTSSKATLPGLENPEGYDVETAQFTDANNTTYPSTSLFIHSLGSASDLNENCLQSVENMDLAYDQHRSFCADEYLQFSNSNCSAWFQNSNLDVGDLQSILNGFQLARAEAAAAATNKAQRSWTKLSSVLRWWFFARKIISLKIVSSQSIRASKRPRIY